MKTLIFCNLAQKCVISLTLISFALLLCSKQAFAQTSKNTTQQPIHIVSDQMVAEKNSSLVKFSGSVKAVIDASTIFADTIKVYFSDNSKKTDTDKKSVDKKNSIQKIIATGDVKYSSGERKAFADKAVYTTVDGILVLTGKSPKLLTGSSFVTGKKITLYRQSNKIIVESDKQERVEAFFNPEDNITQDMGSDNFVQDGQ